MISEQLLWLAVIEQAINDALGAKFKIKTEFRAHLGRRERLLYKCAHVENADEWLTSMSRGYINICWLAGLDPEWVSAKYLSIRDKKISKDDACRIGDRSTVLRYLEREDKIPDNYDEIRQCARIAWHDEIGLVLFT